jgi:hypothetical protein
MELEEAFLEGLFHLNDQRIEPALNLGGNVDLFL